MEIADWTSTAHRAPSFRGLREEGLESYVAELEAFGFTVVPPDVAGITPELVERLRTCLLEVSARRSGRQPDLETGSTHMGGDRATGEHLFYLLYEDPAFEEAVTNPVSLGLITYLLGESALLSSCSASLKGPGGPPLALHSDNAGMPSPFPPYAQVANSTIVLSDYSKENGSLRIVPGSHRWGRQPSLPERFPTDDADAIPIEAPAGSLIVWHGNAWHGAYPRQTPGLRMNLILYFCRCYVKTQETYPGDVPPGFFERSSPRMRALLGCDLAYGWKTGGPDQQRMGQLFEAGLS